MWQRCSWTPALCKEEVLMSSSKLGFGMMRLPQRSPEATDIDFEQVSQMVD